LILKEKTKTEKPTKDNPNAAANVLFITAEDDLNDTIAPRLRKAGADVDCVFSCDDKDTQELSFTSPGFENMISRCSPKLVIADPIQAFLGRNVDMHRANEIRPIMSYLRCLAKEYNCAILLIEHLNKNIGGKSLYRGLGTVDISSATRSILMVGSNPEDDTDKGIAHIKTNCGQRGDVVGFTISNRGLEWNPDTNLTAEAIEGYSNGNGNARPKGTTALDNAKNFLEAALKDGKQASRDVVLEAMQRGILESTLKRARGELGVLCNEREGFGKNTIVYWRLPNADMR